MSTVPLQSLTQPAGAVAGTRPAANRWILNSWADLLLFVTTPFLIVPLVIYLQSPRIGVEVETISLIVAAFGGLGHHFPGMIRAYCDRDLFQRFRWRFVLAPLFLLAVCVPLSQSHLNSMYLVLSVWGCWHALMQVYGFVRIYDVKVGSVATVTAYWDWLMCLCWFSAAQVFSNGKMSRLLEHWYNSGGFLLPSEFVPMLRWSLLGISVLVLIGFLANHVLLTLKGTPPNSIKFLMLASGIGFWWFAMVYVENIVLGIALFEIFHDIQYLAIVWLYNCRRVNTATDVGSFMKFLFRRNWGMFLLYVGLVFAYGAIGYTSNDVYDKQLKLMLGGFVWASTILHFYYDGFIWKVREKSTRAALGLNDAGTVGQRSSWMGGELLHLLKWSPLVVLLCWLSYRELEGTKLSAADPSDAKNPNAEIVRQWPYDKQFEYVQSIAKSVPEDLRYQRRAATMLNNFDRRDEAIQFLEDLLKRHPNYSDGHKTLGEIRHVRGEFELAAASYREAIRTAKTKNENCIANYRLGEIYKVQNRVDEAKAQFNEALKFNPDHAESKAALRELRGQPRSSS